jgi:hypothetical protein
MKSSKKSAKPGLELRRPQFPCVARMPPHFGAASQINKAQKRITLRPFRTRLAILSQYPYYPQ